MEEKENDVIEALSLWARERPSNRWSPEKPEKKKRKPSAKKGNVLRDNHFNSWSTQTLYHERRLGLMGGGERDTNGLNSPPTILSASVLM